MNDLDTRQFERWTSELSDDALELFDRLAEIHLATDRADTRELVWHLSQSLRGGDSSLAWLGRSHRGEVAHAQSDVQELVDARILRRGSGRSRYRLDAKAMRFHAWRSENIAPEAVRHVERATLMAIEDAGRLARRHPTVARHLRDARLRLGADELGDAAVIAIGGSLRAALAGMAADLAGYDGNPELVAAAITPWLQEAEANLRLPPRQAEALSAMVELTSRCAQRLDHLRDERSKGRPEATWEEARRATFLTIVCCYELARV